MTNSTWTKSAPRLAISAGSLARWTGGIDFLRFCVSALDSAAPETTWSVLLPTEAATKSAVRMLKAGIKKLSGMKSGASGNISKTQLVDAFNGSGAAITVIDFPDSLKGLSGAMIQAGAQAVFPCTHSLGRTFPFGWIGYIPDLQHKRLPQWFSGRDFKARDRLFTKLLAEAPAVVVNSAAVLGDIEEFYPDHQARLFSLPFCPPANDIRFSEISAAHVRNTYHLPERYFMISNQFWIHKAHDTAFLALSKAREAGHDVHLVCTGNTVDYRWPQHFSSLMRLIEDKRLQTHIHILGLIPKRDQLEIMRRSIAIVQPTLFEGGPGGGAVYDAISLNIPTIVSDIAVNREIDIGVVRFFKAGSVDDLAARMIEFLENPPHMPKKEETFARLRERQRQYGNFLLDISSSVVSGAVA